MPGFLVLLKEFRQEESHPLHQEHLFLTDRSGYSRTYMHNMGKSLDFHIFIYFNTSRPAVFPTSFLPRSTSMLCSASSFSSASSLVPASDLPPPSFHGVLFLPAGRCRPFHFQASQAFPAKLLPLRYRHLRSRTYKVTDSMSAVPGKYQKDFPFALP